VENYLPILRSKISGWVGLCKIIQNDFQAIYSTIPEKIMPTSSIIIFFLALDFVDINTIKVLK
jgi:hypothetical protein